MTKHNSGDAAKNRGAQAPSDLNIPKLGAEPILQEGESPDALPQAAAHHTSEPTIPQPAGGQPSMADIQRMADAAQAKSTPAMNRPTHRRTDREQRSDAAAVEFELPITGSIDGMRRPDQYIEPVHDFYRFEDHAAELAFLEEMVMIRIHETGDPAAEPVVQLGVNGRQVFIRRGEDVFIRRKYVEQLLRAKPENVATNIRRDADGEVRNMITKTRALKYPFSIVRDDNPLGRAWERKIRAEA
jgi:hypothetical protein